MSYVIIYYHLFTCHGLTSITSVRSSHLVLQYPVASNLQQSTCVSWVLSYVTLQAFSALSWFFLNVCISLHDFSGDLCKPACLSKNFSFTLNKTANGLSLGSTIYDSQLIVLLLQLISC